MTPEAILNEAAIRLWAIALNLKASPNNVTLDDMRHYAEVCDDAAIALSKLTGTNYDQHREAAELCSLEPAYALSRVN